jgi:hypothetical protein
MITHVGATAQGPGLIAVMIDTWVGTVAVHRTTLSLEGTGFQLSSESIMDQPERL